LDLATDGAVTSLDLSELELGGGSGLGVGSRGSDGSGDEAESNDRVLHVDD
jgi:hypothetical protein